MSRIPQFGSRCLADVVPFEHPDDIAVMGRTRDLVQYLRERGADPVKLTVPKASSPRADAESQAFDVVIASVRCPRGSVVVPEVARILRPGGQTVLGARNRLRHLTRTEAWTPGQARRVLAHHGFDDVRVYGVRRSLRSPRFLVPLDDPPAQRWFMRAAFLPDSTPGAVLARLCSAGPLVHVTTLLFRDLVLVATRRGA